MNQLPSGGSCSIDLTNGIALSTYFSITCSNWVDPDGTISSYALIGKFLKNFFENEIK
jgi:hypothetical protein